MKAWRVRAYAKVNLTLEVLGRRPDGYHQVATVLQTVDLWDSLTFTAATDVSLRCTVPALETPENLVWRAVKLLQETTGRRDGVRVTLEKGIPLAAGLGGGSADAAATLRALDRMWGLDMERAKLQALAAQIGADVPFFLEGGTALAEGRGAEVTPLPPLAPTQFVLLFPPFSVVDKTARLYSLLEPQQWSSGQRTGALVEKLQRGQRVREEDLFNVFEEVATGAFPRLDEYRGTLLASGARNVHLSGSGPTLYALVNGPEEGRTILRGLQARGMSARVVSTETPGANVE